MRSFAILRRLVPLGVALALVVVVLGAYTRLSDAGLGCPDWPGCYGFLVVPNEAHEVAAATERYPHAPVEAHKAWAEMVHRYFAGSLGVLVIALAGFAFAARRVGAPWKTAAGLVALVLVQGAFGAWTVTLKLWPQVVTAHLLGGFSTLALLWLLHLQIARLSRAESPRSPPEAQHLRGHAALALAVLIVQITLGGWTTSNYAALACPDFPTCQTQWWPEMDFRKGFDVSQEVGPNYLGGTMHSQARAAIHMTHRLGALVAFVVIGLLAFRLAWRGSTDERRLAIVLGSLLVLQIGLGITNVVGTLPLAVATAHNGVGALLLLAVVSVNYVASPLLAFSGGTVR
jgi:cytochrome c oxidase assembly protein subunit 15